jgi:hypothetical protein
MNDIKEMAKSGEFLREFGTKYFCVVSEAFSIGRVKFTVVPLNNGGKDSADFYLTIQQMVSLCKDINSGVAEKLIDADKEQYPSAYKFVTGENGDKRLNIGGGKIGVRIQISEQTKNKRYLMAVPKQAFMDMATNFMLFSGLAPVTDGSFFKALIDEFNKGRQDRSKWHITLSDSDKITEERTNDEEKTVKEAPAKPQEEGKKQPAPTEGIYTVTATGKMTEKKGFYIFDATMGDENVKLWFKKEEADALNWFNGFKEKAETSGATMPLLGDKIGSDIRYKGKAR